MTDLNLNQIKSRTFETRLLFLKSVYENKLDNSEIMKKSIEHKLKSNLMLYIDELTKEYKNLVEHTDIQIFKNIK